MTDMLKCETIDCTDVGLLRLHSCDKNRGIHIEAGDLEVYLGNDEIWINAYPPGSRELPKVLLNTRISSLGEEKDDSRIDVV